jgi:hypothetical protein
MESKPERVADDGSIERISISASPTVRGEKMPGIAWISIRTGTMVLRVMVSSRSPSRRHE